MSRHKLTRWPRRAGANALTFALNAATFTPAMAKRAGDVFAGAPICQGKWDGTGTGDVLSATRGAQVAGHWYAQLDGYQWYMFGFWTPEKSKDDATGTRYLMYASAAHYFAYDYDNDRFELAMGGQTMTKDHDAVAGTRIAYCAGGSSVVDLDGTNYGRISINDAHTYGLTTQPTASAPDATIYVGGNAGATIADGIQEGVFIVREVPWDGAYGTDMGVGDVIAAHYAASAGADVAETIGSFGVTFCLPTNATEEELVTGTGEAWSHPHSSNLIPSADEKVTNGTFDSDISGWFTGAGTLGFTTFEWDATGKLHAAETADATRYLYSSDNIVAIAGMTYTVSFDLSITSGENVSVMMRNQWLGSGRILWLDNGSGSYSFLWTPTITENCIFQAWTATALATDFTLDNISVVPHTGGWMADGTYTNDGWADEGTPSAVAALAASESIFAGWGYKTTSDAADEGLYQDVTVTAGDDSEIRVIANSDGTSVPRAILYDQTNGAEIGHLDGSTASTKAAPDVLLFTGEAPAGCTTLRVKLVNTAASGVVYWHQVELGDDLWDDPSFEAGTAVTDVGTPTTSAQDAGQAHSGSNSWKVVADAADEGIKRAITTTAGVFYHASAWVYADTAGTVDMEGPTGQDGAAARDTTAVNDAWERLQFVFRATGASTDLQFTSNAAQTFYVDDVAVVALDAVSLTVTPASEANSAEDGGLRIDGRDSLTHPTYTKLNANHGDIRGITYTPRHARADSEKFGQDKEYLLHLYLDADNYIAVYRDDTNVTLAVNAAGGGEQTDVYATAWAADTAKTLRLWWSAGCCKLYLDGVQAAEIASGVQFGSGFSGATLYLGSDKDGDHQFDGVIS